MIRQERKLCQQIERQRKALSRRLSYLQKRVAKLQGSLAKTGESVEGALKACAHTALVDKKKLISKFLTANGFSKIRLTYGPPRVSRNSKHFYICVHVGQKARINSYGQLMQLCKLETPACVLRRMKAMTRMKQELIIKTKEAIRVHANLSELPETI